MDHQTTWLLMLLVNLTPDVGVCATVSSDWERLQNDFWNWHMRRSPEYSTRRGDYRYNDRITPMDISYFSLLQIGVVRFLEELQVIDRFELTQQEQVDFDVLTDMLQTYNESYRWIEYAPVNPFNFLEGPDLTIAGMPFNTRGDFENALCRLQKYPPQIVQSIHSFQTAVSTGHTLHNVSIDRLPGQIDDILTPNPKNSSAFLQFEFNLQRVYTIYEDVKQDMRLRAAGYISEYQRALASLRDYIQQEYLPHTRVEYGVGAWGDGEFYKACLRWHLSMDITPEAVHDIGRREVRRIRNQMKQVMDRLGVTGSIRDFFVGAKENPMYRGNSSDEILALYWKMSQQLVLPKLSTMFTYIPKRTFIVAPMQYDGPGAMYMPGPEDGSRPGAFLVNLFRPNETLTFKMMALLLHETIPGHHFQNAHSQTSSLKNYRKGLARRRIGQVPVSFPSYSAYAEGWGLYAEFLGEEMGLYRDEHELMGRYEQEIFRACRLVIDTGIHMYNWSRGKALEYLMNHTAFGTADAEIEIDRYITWPGQACAYKIGELRIKDIRSRAQERLGKKFDIRDFHTFILNSGRVPLRLLEKIVDQWIDTVEKEYDEHVTCVTSGIGVPMLRELLPITHDIATAICVPAIGLLRTAKNKETIMEETISTRDVTEKHDLSCIHMTRRFIKRNLLLILTVTGIVSGFALGFGLRKAELSRSAILWIGMPGELFLRLLKLMILPLIVCSVISGTASVDAKSNGKISAVAFIYILTTNALSAMVGVLVSLLILPAESSIHIINSENITNKMETEDVFADLLRNLMPNNIVQATFQQTATKYSHPAGLHSGGATNVTSTVKSLRTVGGINVLGLIFTCVMLGIAANGVKEKARPFIAFFTSATDIVMATLRWVLWLTPVGIASLVTVSIASQKDVTTVFSQLGMFVIAVTVGIAVMHVLILPAIFFVIVRRNPYTFLLNIVKGWLIAFATTSTAAAMPELFHGCERKNKIDKRIVRFVIPFCVTLNADGSAVYIVTAAMFVGNMYGGVLGTGDIVLIGILVTFLSLALPSVPSSSIVVLVMLLTSLNIPSSGVALLFAVEWYLDRIRTACNAASHTLCCGITSKFCADGLSKLPEHPKEDIENFSVETLPPQNNTLAV
ncbi:hypothetical protein ScPMuIL_018329 [Solemya velum]